MSSGRSMELGSSQDSQPPAQLPMAVAPFMHGIDAERPASRQGWMDRLVCDEDDTPLQRIRKTSLLKLYPFLGVVSLAFLATTAAEEDTNELAWLLLATTAGVVISIVGLAQLLIQRDVGDRTLTLLIVSLCAIVFFVDLDEGAKGEHSVWVLVVVVLNLSLLLQAPEKLSVGIVSVTVVWVGLINVESVARYGLFDMPGLSSQQSRWASTCGCDKLPCGLGFPNAAGHLTIALMTLLLTYDMARTFATERLHERHMMQTTIDVSRRAVERLVAFDLEETRSILATDDAASLPSAMQEALWTLVCNLQKYRPYLPPSLLPDQQRDAVHAASMNSGYVDATPAPGHGGESVAILFTDIRSSTKIWTTCPHGMKDALALHNTCLRTAFNIHQGYEVKSIGDAFMVAFPAFLDAVRCGLDIQGELLEVDWPESLFAVPECRRDASDLWGGLTLRMGVDYGPVEMELNKLTGRYDYLGEVACRASRLEAKCPPGAVAGRRAEFDEILGWLRIDEEECVRYFRAELKGFEQGYAEIAAVVPSTLKGRWKMQHSEWVHMVQTDPSLGGRMSPRNPASSMNYIDVARAPTPRRVETLTTEPATVATMTLQFPMSIMTQDAAACQEVLAGFFERLQQCLQATLGCMTTTVHTTVVASWHGRCAHREAALRFVSIFCHRTKLHKGEGEPRLSLGLSSGTVFTGSVGGSQQLFVTAVGSCVSLSLHLAATAETLRIPALYGVPADSAAVLPKSVHAVELQFHSNMQYPWNNATANIVVYEAYMESLEDQKDKEKDAKSPASATH